MSIFLGIGLFLAGLIVGYVAFEFRLLNRMDDILLRVSMLRTYVDPMRDDIVLIRSATTGSQKSLDSLANNVTILVDQNKKLQREKLEREQLQRALTGEPSPDAWRAL